MSENKFLDHYKELYSKYVDTRVKLHNYHVVFVENIGTESMIGVRKMLSSMPRLERELRYAARDAFKEQKRLNKEANKLRKTAIRQKKLPKLET